MPSWASRRATFLAIADGDSPSSRAARAKLAWRAAEANETNRSRPIMDPPVLLTTLSHEYYYIQCHIPINLRRPYFAPYRCARRSRRGSTAEQANEPLKEPIMNVMNNSELPRAVFRKEQ